MSISKYKKNKLYFCFTDDLDIMQNTILNFQEFSPILEILESRRFGVSEKIIVIPIIPTLNDVDCTRVYPSRCD